MTTAQASSNQTPLPTENGLRESEQRYYRLFHAAPIALNLSRLDNGQLIEFNDAYVDLVGFSREELLGHTPVELGLFSPEVRAAALANMKAGNMSNVELSITTRSGIVRTCLVSADVIDVAGVKYLLVSSLDITDRQ